MLVCLAVVEELHAAPEDLIAGLIDEEVAGTGDLLRFERRRASLMSPHAHEQRCRILFADQLKGRDGQSSVPISPRHQTHQRRDDRAAVQPAQVLRTPAVAQKPAIDIGVG
jgi:hypothetical protein